METKFKKSGSLTFASSFQNISKVEDLVEEVCANYVHAEDFYGNVLIALTEAVNNAIQHGNSESSDKQVKIDFYTKDDQLFFEVSDEGDGFAFDNLPDPTAPENIEKECGRGIFLMQSLADEVAFENNGARVVLTFNLN